MTNEVAKVQNPFGSVTMTDRKAMAEKAAASAADGKVGGGAPDGSDYFNFSGKRGRYTIGKDQRVVENDELWVINVASFQNGYTCWKGGKSLANRFWNIYNGVPIQRPDPEELGPFGDKEGWSDARAWVSKSLDFDQQGYFKNNSISGVSEMSLLIEEVGKRMGNGQPCWPVIKYDMEEFEAKGHKNFKPIFKIYGWLNDDMLAHLDDEDMDIDDLIAKSAVESMLPAGDASAEPEVKAEGDRSDPPAKPAQPTQRRRRRSASA